ncbi:Nnf1-domain-containing protein [Rhexocercosporidium sp. MPI-PUGE-AT-0058]|nr:Nnf1-domain-containing protein [Rhexocercosporidium sp. MPI-PUGE-AT-0058]
MSTTAVPPSPSPPPLLPTPSTPGVRATVFTKLYNDALAKTLTAISYPSFASCFPSIAEQAPAALKGMHADMAGKLERFAKEEFETILRERDVVGNLNRLEDLVKDAGKRKARGVEGVEVVPPHTLPPAALLRSHTTPLHQSQQSHLNAKLQTTESQNATLIEEIRRQRKEIEELLALGEMLVRDLEGAGERLGESGEELARRGREAEGVLAEEER